MKGTTVVDVLAHNIHFRYFLGPDTGGLLYRESIISSMYSMAPFLTQYYLIFTVLLLSNVA